MKIVIVFIELHKQSIKERKTLKPWEKKNYLSLALKKQNILRNSCERTRSEWLFENNLLKTSEWYGRQLFTRQGCKKILISLSTRNLSVSDLIRQPDSRIRFQWSHWAYLINHDTTLNKFDNNNRPLMPCDKILVFLYISTGNMLVISSLSVWMRCFHFHTVFTTG